MLEEILHAITHIQNADCGLIWMYMFHNHVAYLSVADKVEQRVFEFYLVYQPSSLDIFCENGFGVNVRALTPEGIEPCAVLEPFMELFKTVKKFDSILGMGDDFNADAN